MKSYRHFLQDSIAYWQARVRVLGSALYLLYSTPVDSPLLGRSRTRLRGKQEAVAVVDQTRIKRGVAPGLRGGFALFPVPVR